jgi:hypothetical protein
MMSSFSSLDCEESVDEAVKDLSSEELVFCDTLKGLLRVDNSIQGVWRSSFSTTMLQKPSVIREIALKQQCVLKNCFLLDQHRDQKKQLANAYS